MASLTGKKIKDTYDGLLKVEDNEQITDVKKKITDGFGNESGLAVDNAGNVDVQNDLNVGGDAVVDQNLDVDGSLSVTGTISDSQGLKGANGQLLSSTNVGTEWVDISGTYATKSELDAEVTNRENADDLLEGQITDETTARQNADSTLQSNIDAEASARASADTSLQNSINTEEGERIAGDQALQDQINSNDIAIGDLENNLAQEVINRTNADQDLYDAIDTEQSARISGDNTLQSNLNSEVSARTSADAVLQGQINSNDSEISQLNSDLTDEANARISGDANLQTQIDNLGSTLVDDFVPYTGSTNNVDLGNYTIATNAVRLNGLTETDGTITWNQNEGCIQVNEGNTQLQVGQEIYFHVRNASTTNTIPNGTAVMAVGAQGVLGTINVAPMNAIFKPDPKYFIGIATEDIAPEQEGKVTWFGKVHDVDTSNFNIGDTLYVGVDGVLTNVSNPTYNIECALAVNSRNDGTIFVRAVEKLLLENIVNVDTTGAGNGDVLAYDSANNYWYATSALKDEELVRIAADNSLQANIDVVSNDVDDLEDALTLETANRVSGDSTLQAYLDAESLARATADSGLQDNIDSEETARIDADAILQGNIDAEIIARQSGDDALQSNINDEETARINADDVLDGRIDDEAVTREGADQELQDDIDAEVVARTDADDALQAQIDNNDIDIADLYASKEDVANKGVANGYASLDANAKVPTSQLPDSVLGQLQYQGTWDADTDTPTLPDASTAQGHYYVVSVEGTYETILYHVGDWIVSNGTAWEKVDNTDAVTSVFGRLGNVVANEADYSGFYPLIQDLTDETNARETADTALQADIDQEVLDRQSGDTALQGQIDSHDLDIQANADAIAQEVLDRQEGDTTNADAIAQEVTDRETADTNLQTNIDAVAGDLALHGLQAVTDIDNTTNTPVIFGGPVDVRDTLTTDRLDIGADVDGVLNVLDVDSNEILIATSTGTQVGGASASRNLKVYGDIEGDAIKVAGGGATQFLKADGSLDSNAYITSADVTPPNNANIDINAGNGLSGGGSFTTDQATNANINLSHADTSTQTDVVGTTNTFVDGVTLDTYGHVTGLTTQSVTIPNPNDATITLEGGTNIETIIGSFTTDQSSNATLTINHGDTSTLDGGYGALGDRPFQVTVDPNGHVVAVDTAPLIGNSGGGIEVSPTPPAGFDFEISHGNTSDLNGTYGSTSNATKIDTITIDEYGHVTAITTGGTGDIDAVNAGAGLTGGGTSGSVTISHLDTSPLQGGSYGGYNPIIGAQEFIKGISIDGFGHVNGIEHGAIMPVGDGVIMPYPTAPTGYDFGYYLDIQALGQNFANTTNVQVGFSGGQIQIEPFPNGLMGFNGDTNITWYATAPTDYQVAADLAPRLKVSTIDFDGVKGFEDGGNSDLRFTSNVTGVFNFEDGSGRKLQLKPNGWGNAGQIATESSDNALDLQCISPNTVGGTVRIKPTLFSWGGWGDLQAGDYDMNGYGNLLSWGYNLGPGGAVEGLAGVTINNGMDVLGNGVVIFGSLDVWGPKNFRIDHPLKPETHDLVHTVIESNRGDVMYRGKLKLTKGKAEVNLDDFIGMTNGTFEALTKDVQVFTTNEDGWTQVKGRVTGSTLEIFAEDSECANEVSFLVMGERKDDAYVNSEITDSNGKLILEPEGEAMVERNVSYEQRIRKQNNKW